MMHMFNGSTTLSAALTQNSQNKSWIKT